MRRGNAFRIAGTRASGSSEVGDFKEWGGEAGDRDSVQRRWKDEGQHVHL